jgi:hypothetical protein
VSSVAGLIRQFGTDIDDTRLIQALGNGPKGAVSIISAADRVSKELGGGAVNAACEYLVRSYNRSRGKKLPRWGET